MSAAKKPEWRTTTRRPMREGPGSPGLFGTAQRYWVQCSLPDNSGATLHRSHRHLPRKHQQPPRRPRLHSHRDHHRSLAKPSKPFLEAPRLRVRARIERIGEPTLPLQTFTQLLALRILKDDLIQPQSGQTISQAQLR